MRLTLAILVLAIIDISNETDRFARHDRQQVDLPAFSMGLQWGGPPGFQVTMTSWTIVF